MTHAEPNAPGWWTVTAPYGIKYNAEVRRGKDGMEVRLEDSTRWQSLRWVIESGWHGWQLGKFHQ